MGLQSNGWTRRLSDAFWGASGHLMVPFVLWHLDGIRPDRIVRFSPKSTNIFVIRTWDVPAFMAALLACAGAVLSREASKSRNFLLQARMRV